MLDSYFDSQNVSWPCVYSVWLIPTSVSHTREEDKRDNLLLLLKNHLGAMDISQGPVCKYQGSVPTIVPKEQKVTQAQSIANRHNCQKLFICGRTSHY